MLAKEMDISELVCYLDSLHCINLIKGPNMMFNVYALLIQDIKDLIEQCNVIICHILHERNQCADFMAKLRASSNMDLLLHDSPLEDLWSLPNIDAVNPSFSRVVFVLFVLFLF